MSPNQPPGALQRPTPTVTDSLDRVVDAAQNVVADQVELLRVEATSTVASALQSGAMAISGGALLLLGWVIGLMAAFQLVAPRTGVLGALGILAAVNLIIGGALLLAARRGSTGASNG